jgi:selenocysteine lyase/cysteine desulfurase
VSAALGRRGIFVWDGNYYALELMQRLGLEDSGGAVRVGAVHYNTPAELDTFLTAVRELA